jgi:hypothetical protein
VASNFILAEELESSANSKRIRIIFFFVVLAKSLIPQELEMKKRVILYECGICGCLHPWDWNGDCREDKNRYNDAEDYALRNNLDEMDIDVLAWEDRLREDEELSS